MNDTIRYVTGLDLGQAADLTALAVLEKTTGPDPYDPNRKAKYYAVRHLERFMPGTSSRPYACACTSCSRSRR